MIRDVDKLIPFETYQSDMDLAFRRGRDYGERRCNAENHARFSERAYDIGQRECLATHDAIHRAGRLDGFLRLGIAAVGLVMLARAVGGWRR